jgi:hypothetical protein
MGQLQPHKRARLEKAWDSQLGHQMHDLPHFEKVMRELTRKLREYGLFGVK